ncbi:Ubiquitinyl hydrolase 1 [Aphelenchoides bicaudatus]|nr:Ubiquitinyl hydrolase 1 [Aphelenchoides bicaudatus]
MSQLEVEKNLFHEKQHRQLCLLHTLNNLFQRQEYAKEELDRICETFDSSYWFNSHRSVFGFGNYDVNILLRALETRGLEATWFDKRLSAKEINHDAVHSYVFNVPSTSYIPFFRNGRHWFAVKKFGSRFYNLDSKLPEPTQINDFVLFANEILSNNNELFLVCEPSNRERLLLTNSPRV